MTEHIAQIPRIRPLRVAILLLAAGGLALLVPLSDHGWLFFSVTVMAMCLALPMARDWSRSRFDAFELVHVIGFRHFLFFGAGALWAVGDPYEVAYDMYLVPYIPIAAFYCLLGYLFLLGGYYGPWFRKREPRRVEDVPIGPWVLWIPGVLGIVGTYAGFLLEQAFWSGRGFSGVVSSTAQLSPLYYFSWALAWLLVLSGRATTSQRWTLYVGFIPITASFLLIGLTDKSQVLMMFAVPVMALWYARRVLPWRSLLALILVMVFVVFPFFNSFRWLDPSIPIGQRMWTTTDNLVNMSYDEYMQASVGAVKSRFALVNSVAVLIRDVPRWVPYENGATLFLPTLAFFIPRFVWPDKPLFMMGRDFGEKFRVVNILDDKTRISVTVPGELYWNFDLPGILVGMALWGAVLRLAYRRYAGSSGLDPVRRAIYMLVVILFVHFGGGLAPQVVGLVRVLIILEVFCWVCRRLGLIQTAPVDAASAPILSK